MRLSTLHKKLMKDPAYRKAYNALEEEFALIAEVAKARHRSGLNHPQLMRRMKTTRRTMTRLENGRDVSIQTLSRFAKATGHRLKISFEPVKKRKSG
jgi:transcriptional regulator with XRE-family HTH domain